MPTISLLGQFDPYRLSPEAIALYVPVTLAFAFLVWLVAPRVRSMGTVLIMWGLLTAMLAIGYGLLALPPIAMLAPTLMKIAVLLIVGGIASHLLTSCAPNSTSKEPDRVG